MQDSLLSLPNLLTFTKLVQTKSQNKQLCPDQHPGNHTETEVFTVFEVGIFFFGGGFRYGKPQLRWPWMSTWRIIPVSKKLVTVVIISPRFLGLFSFQMAFSWLTNEGYLLTTYFLPRMILQVECGGYWPRYCCTTTHLIHNSLSHQRQRKGPLDPTTKTCGQLSHGEPPAVRSYRGYIYIYNF